MMRLEAKKQMDMDTTLPLPHTNSILLNCYSQIFWYLHEDSLFGCISYSRNTISVKMSVAEMQRNKIVWLWEQFVVLKH